MAGILSRPVRARVPRTFTSTLLHITASFLYLTSKPWSADLFFRSNVTVQLDRRFDCTRQLDSGGEPAGYGPPELVDDSDEEDLPKVVLDDDSPSLVKLFCAHRG